MNLSSSQRDLSGQILGDLSNNRRSGRIFLMFDLYLSALDNGGGSPQSVPPPALMTVLRELCKPGTCGKGEICVVNQAGCGRDKTGGKQDQQVLDMYAWLLANKRIGRMGDVEEEVSSRAACGSYVVCRRVSQLCRWVFNLFLAFLFFYFIFLLYFFASRSH